MNSTSPAKPIAAPMSCARPCGSGQMKNPIGIAQSGIV